ncbi:hypothetical protein [Novosphingobium sp.]|uniref:hypothetical protein n=1 Tax=Novosphingobium sp. TaxID=1874826 RepID=UPI00286A4382|nr:hypothetical protein [Novosphingobium sp.]
MIDNFSLVVTHALLALALWRLVQRSDLDTDPPPAEPPPPPPEPAPRKVTLRA